MFDDVESKLKTGAVVNFIAGIIMAFICLIVAANSESLRTVFIVLTAVMIVSALVGSWLIYGFAEIIENSKELCRLAKATDFGTVKGSEKLKLKHEEEEIQRELDAQHRCVQQEQEQAKKARIDAYWSAHPDEKEKLLSKKAEAERILNNGKNLGAQTLNKVKDFISAIDNELTKDR